MGKPVLRPAALVRTPLRDGGVQHRLPPAWREACRPVSDHGSQGHSVLFFGHKWAPHVEAGTMLTKRFDADSYQSFGSLG